MSEYIGNELELFKHAKNWKSYYKRKVEDFIIGDVWDVGAGSKMSLIKLNILLKGASAI
jgi:hypothetical protein